MGTLDEFHIRFHGWRIFAKKEVGITLDELFQITMSQHEDQNQAVLTHGTPAVTEQLCETTLKLNQQYLDLVSTLVQHRSDGDGELDLEARAQRFAREMAEAVDLHS